MTAEQGEITPYEDTILYEGKIFKAVSGEWVKSNRPVSGIVIMPKDIKLPSSKADKTNSELAKIIDLNKGQKSFCIDLRNANFNSFILLLMHGFRVKDQQLRLETGQRLDKITILASKKNREILGLAGIEMFYDIQYDDLPNGHKLVFEGETLVASRSRMDGALRIKTGPTRILSDEVSLMEEEMEKALAELKSRKIPVNGPCTLDLSGTTTISAVHGSRFVVNLARSTGRNPKDANKGNKIQVIASGITFENLKMAGLSKIIQLTRQESQ